MALAYAQDPQDLDVRLSYRNFVQLVSRGEKPADEQKLLEQYQAYRDEFQRRSLWRFFSSHCDEAWFLEKYSPSEPYATLRRQRRRAGRLGRKSAWLAELRSGKLDKISLDLYTSDLNKPIQQSETPASPPEAARSPPGLSMHTITNRYGVEEHFDSDVLPVVPDPERQLLVRVWPPDLPREALEDHLRSQPGFLYVALLEPIVQRKWHRSGIAVFTPGTDVRAAVGALDGKSFGEFVLHLSVMEHPSTTRLRVAPESASALERLSHDLGRARQLVAQFEQEDRKQLFSEEDAALDASNAAAGEWGWLREGASTAVTQHCTELGVDMDATDPEVRRRALKLQLDLHIDVLRQVYHCDYYMSLVCDFPEELVRRSGQHVRRQPADPAALKGDQLLQRDAWWTDHLDRKTELLLHSHDPDVLRLHGGDAAIEGTRQGAYFAEYIRDPMRVASRTHDVAVDASASAEASLQAATAVPAASASVLGLGRAPLESGLDPGLVRLGDASHLPEKAPPRTASAPVRPPLRVSSGPAPGPDAGRPRAPYRDLDDHAEEQPVDLPY